MNNFKYLLELPELILCLFYFVCLVLWDWSEDSAEVGSHSGFGADRIHLLLSSVISVKKKKLQSRNILWEMKT